MPVQYLAGHLCQAARHSRKQLLHNRNAPAVPRLRRLSGAEPEISKRRASRPEMLFESAQPWIVQIRAPEIELLSTTELLLLNGFPKQHRHSTQVVESCIGTAVFIKDCILVRQGENARNGPAIFECKANREAFTKTITQIPEPWRWLRRESVAPSGKQKQVIEVLQTGV